MSYENEFENQRMNESDSERNFPNESENSPDVEGEKEQIIYTDGYTDNSDNSGDVSSTIPEDVKNDDVKPEDKPEGESVGIRYDSDKSTNGGNYTWNYSEGNKDASSDKKKKKEKSNKGFTVFVSLAMVFVILGTAVVSSLLTIKVIKDRNLYVGDRFFAGERLPFPKDKEDKKDRENAAQPFIQIPEKSDGEALTKQEIATKCKPSSVGIEVVSTSRSIYGYSYQKSGVGSGFILSEDGYIATNHHVIENADKITVMLDDGTRYDATLVGSDSITDLAVIKIEAPGLVPMEIGDSDKMVVGDAVVAIGTPAGIEFAGTVTDGIISAINRGVEITNERGTVVKTMTLMQTNAAINPGNSGGPLINARGEVIGINTLKLTSAYEGIGFSIPINSAVKIFNQLINDGKVSEYDNSFVTGNGAIGITQYAEISEQESEYYDIPEGIIVIQINNTSSAFAAGLRRGDIIIAFNEEQVKTVEQLNRLKNKHRAGDEVTIRVHRDGEGEKDITFKLDLMQS